MHLLDLDGGRVRLLLAFGDIAQVLPDLVLQADAFYLDGVAPDRNPAMWDARLLRTLARLAAPQATAATWSVAGALRQGLAAAGFVVDQAPGDGGQRQMTVARFAPRFTPHPPPPGRAPLPAMASTRTRAEPAPPQPARHAAASVPHRMPGAVRVAVVGAGLAGAAMAAVLAARRLDVQVFERHGGPAAETSGNAGGLFHGVVHAQDGPHARWLRAAALHAERVLRPMLEGGTVPGKVCGLLRGEQQMAPAAMQRLLHVAALPADYLQAVPHTDRAAWFYPGGGWVSPAALAAHWLQRPGLRTRFGTAVSQLRRTPDGWQLLDAAGGVLADADAVVLCNAADAQRLAPGAAWPLQRLRGQTTVLPAGLPGAPQLPHPQADAGYALTLDDGRLLCGATSQAGDDDPALRAADHAANLATLQRLTGWSPPPGAPLDGRVGWRLTADDRLPLLGPVPDSTDPAVVHGAGLLTQPRHVPRLPGLWVMTALGSRGITQAPLAAEVLASWLTGEPVPLPAALLDAVDAARFVSRGVRRGG
jgi:tRNA 5-methylaminomethyl-2-thiouridine biosynthesis bifunctional protein